MALINVDITDSINTFRIKVNQLATLQGDLTTLSAGPTSDLVSQINDVRAAVDSLGSNADFIDVDQVNDNTAYQVSFVPTNSGDAYVKPLIDTDDTHFVYNPLTNSLSGLTTVTADNFVGTLVGGVSYADSAGIASYADSAGFAATATTATTATSATTATTATTATNVTVTNDDTAGASRIVFHSGAVGNVGLKSTAGVYLDAATDTLSANGDIIAFAASDRELKDNIQPIENAVSLTKQISGNTFTWKTMPGVHPYAGDDVGVIAQEIEAVLPQLVHTRDSGYKAVKYDKLVALLIEAVKELSARIEVLEGNG